MTGIVFRTHRLSVRRATSEDATFIHALWTCPDVMRYVGFPDGLDITVDEVRRQIEATCHADFGSRLIVERVEDGATIGQTKLGVPDSEGICEPDIKFRPEVWGNGYGKELWQALIDHAFVHSSTSIVQGTPNRANTASVRMQLASGMKVVGQGVFQVDVKAHPGAVAVPYLKLQITRQDWLKRRDASNATREDS
jgi:ribosomal-protein-alanine N-acetyltransferase